MSNVKEEKGACDEEDVTKNRTAEDEAEYESYSETCSVYDQRRVAIGLNFITDAIDRILSERKCERKDIVLLDAGCGTGNYTSALAKHVGRIVAMDFNEGMLSKCREKCAAFDNVFLKRGSLLGKLPFEDGSVDVVIINQVLHHIAGNKKFENTGHVISEFSRILSKGGALVVNTQDPEQHMKGFWWANIIPQAAKRLADRLVSVDKLTEMMKRSRLDVQRVEIPPQPLMRLQKYLDAEGPFKKTYRNGDSTWSLATDAELKTGLERYKTSIYDKGEAEAYIKEREAIRRKIGQTTSIVAFRT
eukprot:g2075.t1